MIYLEVSLEDHLSKYNLEIEDYHCPKCGQDFKTTIPVLTKDSAGLQSPIHECGSGYYCAILTPRTKEAIEFWNTIV